MRSRSIKQDRLEVVIITVVAILVFFVALSQEVFSQVRIGGISIDAVKRTDVKQVAKTGTKDQTDGSTANAVGDDPPDSFLRGMVYDIGEAKQDVESYTPQGKIYLVRSTLMPWLIRAISPKAREAFAVEKKFNDWRKANTGNKFDTELDALAAAAAAKLPAYVPHANNFAIRDAALERMMVAKLKNGGTVKIQKIGIFHANWQIEKNSLGLPENRYREAYIWGKDSADDHSYCHLYGFVIQQDYSGGGTYGATWVYQNTDAIFGCPAK